MFCQRSNFSLSLHRSHSPFSLSLFLSVSLSPSLFSLRITIPPCLRPPLCTPTSLRFSPSICITFSVCLFGSQFPSTSLSLSSSLSNPLYHPFIVSLHPSVLLSHHPSPSLSIPPYHSLSIPLCHSYHFSPSLCITITLYLSPSLYLFASLFLSIPQPSQSDSHQRGRGGRITQTYQHAAIQTPGSAVI